MEFCEIELTTYLRVYSIFQKNRSDTVEVKPGDIQAELFEQVCRLRLL